MTSYNQGAMGAAVGEEVPEALASSLLPAPGNNKSYGWVVGQHDLWYTPLKPLSLFGRNRLELVKGSWAGLAPGTSLEVTATVLVPCGPQQQQQQQAQQQQQQAQQAQEEVVLPVMHGMPGQWQVSATSPGKVTCASDHSIRLYSSLFQQLQPLVADHFLLRVQYDQVGCT
jgi:hypothetical protein